MMPILRNDALRNAVPECIQLLAEKTEAVWKSLRPTFALFSKTF